MGLRSSLWVLLFSATLVIPATAQDADTSSIHQMLGGARHPWARWPDFPRYVDDLARLYPISESPLVWLEDGRVSGPARDAILELAGASSHGLDPRDYDARLLDSVAAAVDQESVTPDQRASFDLLLSLDLIRYLDDLRTGRLRDHPLSSADTASHVPDWPSVIRDAIAGDSIHRLVRALTPRFAQYQSLRVQLARYRGLAADSSIRPVPVVKRVEPGDTYRGAPLLRHMLARLGDLQPGTAPDTSSRYDPELVEAVRHFQERHGLDPDGVIGAHTFAQLNVPLSRRVRQIELGLERLRWLPPLTGPRLIVVNIPAFQLFAFDTLGGTGAPALSMRVVVGKAFRDRTPVLLEQLRYLEFRPYWNVPRSILRNEIIPILRRRPGYLRANDMELVTGGDQVLGDEVDPDIVSRLVRGELRVRQKPGPQNAMGPAKFVFPNAADVYLHGTPQTELFTRTRRDFSHGCIRVEHPLGLASWILDADPAWPPDSVRAAAEGPTTRRVLLAEPIPVLVFYATTLVRPDGSVWFYQDIYGHDRELDEALRGGAAPP